MNAQPEHNYDVVIMGAGIAGLWQARHLMLKIPGIRVAIVDPRSEEETLEVKKIGESMVEVAALFAYKELGLHEYLVDNHSPKYGLNFHWPKNTEKTEDMEDYFSVWNNRNPPIASFQLHRGKFEVDLLRMNKDMGADHFQAKVVDLDLNPGDEDNVVWVKDGENRFGIACKHLVDAAGRAFLTARRKDNLIQGPENLYGLDNGSVWLRVENVDRELFHSGIDPLSCATSHYYGTNHFFGHGHWLWMIPIEREPLTLSIGVMYHRQEIPASDLATEEKFRGFLAQNHKILSNLVESGETVDFRVKNRCSYLSKEMFSEDNWYAIGDAAAFGDAFYSLGTTTIAFACESVTEIVRAKLAGERDAEDKRSAFNDFNCWYARTVVHTYRKHHNHLGHASVMSWRVYFENMWWFGTHIPMYVGKWHLEPKFIRQLLANCERHYIAEVYEEFDKLVAENKNIGFMDCYRADQLAFGYNCPHHFDRFLENARYNPKVCDIYQSFSSIYFFIALYWLKLQWKGFGVKGLARPRVWYHFFRLLKQSGKTKARSLLHKLEMRKVPDNPVIHEMRKEFEGYTHMPELKPWTEGKEQGAAA